MNDMKRYLARHKKNRGKIRDLARRVGVSRIYLTQIGSEHSRASGPLARRLDEETGGEIRKGSLRSDIFGAVDSFVNPVSSDANNVSAREEIKT